MEIIKGIMHHMDQKGWEYTKPGWHEATVLVEHPSQTFYKYEEIIAWLYERIDNCERHCRWYARSNFIKVKFRYERDYEWFHLAWV